MPKGAAAIYRVPIDRLVDAVISRFDVETPGHGKVHVVATNMHIVCSDHPPSIIRRQPAVRLLRHHFDGLAAPVVCIMAGENNLDLDGLR